MLVSCPVEYSCILAELILLFILKAAEVKVKFPWVKLCRCCQERLASVRVATVNLTTLSSRPHRAAGWHHGLLPWKQRSAGRHCLLPWKRGSRATFSRNVFFPPERAWRGGTLSNFIGIECVFYFLFKLAVQRCQSWHQRYEPVCVCAHARNWPPDVTLRSESRRNACNNLALLAEQLSNLPS